MPDIIRSAALDIARKALSEARAGRTTASQELEASIRTLIASAGHHGRPLVRVTA